jgi:hypothetical protein
MNSQMTLGSIVRVKSKSCDSSQRAILALMNEDDGISWDVIYNAGSIEEVNVHPSRIENLQDFEISMLSEGEGDSTPLDIKDRGNYLFQTCKDYDAAIELYLKCIKSLSINGLGKDTYSVGASVLVSTQGSLHVRPGIISDVDTDTDTDTNNHNTYTYDIMYEDGDEEEGVTRNRMQPLGEVRHRVIQRAAYLNLSRCFTKKGLHGWAIHYSSLAIAVTEMISGIENGIEEYIEIEYVSLNSVIVALSAGNGNDTSDAVSVSKKWIKNMADALYLRGKALLSAGRPNMSTKDMKLLCVLDEVKGQSLLRDIQGLRQLRHKSDKKLAKAMVGWVNTAMTMAGQGMDVLEETGDIRVADDDGFGSGSAPAESKDQIDEQQDQKGSGWFW